MKTEKMTPVEQKNQPVDLSQEKRKKYEIAREAATSTVGGVIGGFAGAAIGSAIAQEAYALDEVEPQVDTPDPVPVKPEPAKPNAEELVEPEKPVEPAKPVAPVEPEEPLKPEEPTRPEDTEVQVLHYETAQTEEGHTLQVAIVSENGEIVQYADVTGDDIVDLRVTDTNNDGDITEDEITDISGQGMSMQPLRQAYQEAQEIAQYTDENEPDYINDGNVDDFMA